MSPSASTVSVRNLSVCLLWSLLLQAPLVPATAAEIDPTYLKASEAGPDFPIQGEYLGDIKTTDGEVQIGLQVIAVGKGRFQSKAFQGGLPGAGWNREAPLQAEARLNDGKLVFAADSWEAKLQDGAFVVSDSGRPAGSLKKINRLSPTYDNPPPEGAVVLFDGKNADAWKGGKVSEEGWLIQGTTSKQRFGDFRLHLEFMLPFQPEDSQQGRGNSGVYLQGRYEVQVLDSFGLQGKDNECGGLYSVKAPDLNMCLPPLQWQTYDIDYTAAKYQDGKLTTNPRITVRHNNVVIHKDVELPGERSTTAAPVKPGPDPGPIYLQDHGNPVRFRNIWLIEK